MIGAGLIRNFVGQVNAIKAAVLASLAAAGGAAGIGYMPGGTGAVARTAEDALRDRVSLDGFMNPAQRAAMRSNDWTGIDITAFTAAVQAAFDAAKARTLEIVTPAYIKVNKPIVWDHYTAVVGLSVPAKDLGVMFFPDLSIDWPTLYPDMGVLTAIPYLAGLPAYPAATAAFWTGIGKQFQVRADIDAANFAAFRSRVPDYGIVIWCPNESVMFEHVQSLNFRKGNWLCGGVASVPTFLHCGGMAAGSGQDTVFGQVVTRAAAPFGAQVSVYWDAGNSTALVLEAATATDLDTLAAGNVLTIGGAQYTVQTVPAATVAINDRTVIGGAVTTARFCRRITLTAAASFNGRIYPAGIAFRNHPRLDFAPGVAAASGGRGNSGSARLIGFSGDSNAALVYVNGAQSLEVISPKAEANNSLVHVSGTSTGGARARVHVSSYRADGFGTFDGGLVRITGSARPSVVMGTGQVVGYVNMVTDQSGAGSAENHTVASLYGQGFLHYCTDGSEIASFANARVGGLTVGDLSHSAMMLMVDGTDSVNRRMTFNVANATDVYRIRVGAGQADVFTVGGSAGQNVHLWSHNGAATEKVVKLAASGGVGSVTLGLSAAQKVAFFGAAPVVQQALPAAATDAATTQALANALRTALVNLGLAA